MCVNVCLTSEWFGWLGPHRYTPCINILCPKYTKLTPELCNKPHVALIGGKLATGSLQQEVELLLFMDGWMDGSLTGNAFIHSLIGGRDGCMRGAGTLTCCLASMQCRRAPSLVEQQRQPKNTTCHAGIPELHSQQVAVGGVRRWLRTSRFGFRRVIGIPAHLLEVRERLLRIVRPMIPWLKQIFIAFVLFYYPHGHHATL